MKKINGWFWQDVEETTSTNDAVRPMYQALQKPVVLSAKRQSAGRGRRGRVWESQEGNLFMSMAYPGKLEEGGHLVILCGIAVLRMVKHFCPAADVNVKWPNDVLAEGGKIAGILFERGEGETWITGIGINVVSHPDLPCAGYKTSSLKALGSNAGREEVLAEILVQFDGLAAQLMEKGFGSLKQTWLDNAYNVGKKVIVKQLNGNKEGILTDLDDDGALVLQTVHGREKIIVGDLFVKEEKNG